MARWKCRRALGIAALLLGHGGVGKASARTDRPAAAGKLRRTLGELVAQR